jgi:hypothetical protein
VTLAQFKSLLTRYEQEEIHDWAEIFFAGSATVEKIGSSRRKTGADLHSLFNLPRTVCDTDSEVYNNGTG